MPTGPYLVIPEVSSERRTYIPIGFLTPEIICSNKLPILPDASPYHFGVLSSKMHMAWVKQVTGRLKSDFQYSVTLVYNNYPWPSAPTPAQRSAVEAAAQRVLDARAHFMPPTNPRPKLAPEDRSDKFVSYAEDFQITAADGTLIQPHLKDRKATLADLYDPLAMPPALTPRTPRSIRLWIAATAPTLSPPTAPAWSTSLSSTKN